MIETTVPQTLSSSRTDITLGTINVLNVKHYHSQKNPDAPKLPKGVLVLQRPQTLSNPYKVSIYGRNGCLRLFRWELFQHIQWGGLPDWAVVADEGKMPREIHALGKWQMAPNTFERFEELATRVARGETLNLACSCKPLDCHLDVIKGAIEWFNSQRISKGWTLPPIIDIPIDKEVKATALPKANKLTLPCITLKRPWPTAILKWGKRLENRSWKPNLSPGDQLLIHAGSGWDKDGALWLKMQGFDVGEESDHPKGIVAIAQFDGVIESSEDLWWIGPLGWKLSNVRLLEPIPAKGKQNLWSVTIEKSVIDNAIVVDSFICVERINANKKQEKSFVLPNDPPCNSECNREVQSYSGSEKLGVNHDLNGTIPQNSWAQVQKIRCGASPSTCTARSSGGDVNENPYKYDSRAYGDALRGNYPHIQQWLDGAGDEMVENEWLVFAMDAVNRGSMPMLEVAALGGLQCPSRSVEFISQFADGQKPKLFSLFRIAIASAANPIPIKEWALTLGIT